MMQNDAQHFCNTVAGYVATFLQHCCTYFCESTGGHNTLAASYKFLICNTLAARCNTLAASCEILKIYPPDILFIIVGL